MLRVFSIAGEQLAAASVEEIEDVRELKSALRQLHGFPLCLQKLLCNGSPLQDADRFDSTTDIQLLLLSVSTDAQRNAAGRELIETSKSGRAEARFLLRNFNFSYYIEETLIIP